MKGPCADGRAGRDGRDNVEMGTDSCTMALCAGGDVGSTGGEQPPVHLGTSRSSCVLKRGQPPAV